MKKSYSLLGCFALFLLSLVLVYKPVNAAEPKVINLSDLEEDEVFKLTEDSVLNLDTDKSINSINTDGYELTISGTGTVRCKGVSTEGSGKVIMDNGSLVCEHDISQWGDAGGSLVVNNGSITAKSLVVDHITINGGYIHAETINKYYGHDSSLSIYGGHVELTEMLRMRKIYIDDNMFVAVPWNKEPEYEPDYDDSYVMGSKYGVKIMPKSEVVSVDEISISETTCSIAQGEKKQLSVSLSPENATNKIVRWSSSNSTVARVDKYEGVVEALRPGKAIITATAESGELTQTCEVTVPDTGISQEGLVIEASSVNYSNDKNQPYIKVKYNGVELKEGTDYVINKDYNDDTYVSVTTITGLDEYIRKADKK